MQVKLVSEGNKKIATDLCVKLGRAYQLNMNEQIIECWNEIIRTDSFMNRMISLIQIKGDISKGDFIKHIVYSSSNSNSNNTRAGASAVIEILKLTRIIKEQDGRITIGNGNIEKKKDEQELNHEKNEQIAEVKKMRL